MTTMSMVLALSEPGGGSAAGLAVTMLVIFGSAKILAELFERMRLPGLVGEILAGVLVGPAVLGWIAPGAFTTAMAELGVMFLLFRVGVEIDAKELGKVGGTATMVGVLGVAVPFVGGWGLYTLWGKPTIEAVFVGAALTATSVGITAQVLASRGLLDRTASRIILAAAVIDDVLALLVLGGVSGLAEGRANVLELVLTSVFALGFVVIVARWGGSTLGEAVNRMERRIRMGEGHFALAMVGLFGLAALSGRAGVAPIIGAFLAGMAMGPGLSPRVHHMARGVSELLVPFFLINIGLHFNPSVFRDGATIALAGLLVVTAIATKVIGCGIGAARFGSAIAVRVAVGMIPRGEFCMVVAQIGLGLAAIQSDTYSLVVFMAVAVTVITAPLLQWAFRSSVPPAVSA